MAKMRGSEDDRGQLYSEVELNEIVARFKGRRQMNTFEKSDLIQNVNLLARLYTTPLEDMDVHNDIIDVIHRVHGKATLHQTTVFLLSFHKIHDQSSTSYDPQLISAFQKVLINDEIISKEEKCSMFLVLLGKYRNIFLKVNEEYIHYYGNVKHSTSSDILHQKEIYHNLCHQVESRTNFRDLPKEQEIDEILSEIHREYILTIFNINMEGDDFFSQVYKCLRFVNFIWPRDDFPHWSGGIPGLMDDDDIIFVVNKLCFGNEEFGEVHQKIKKKIINCDSIMNEGVLYNVYRITKVPSECLYYLINKGIDPSTDNVDSNEHRAAMIKAAFFYSEFNEEVVDFKKNKTLNMAPSPTGDGLGDEQRLIIRKILWKLSFKRTFNDRHFDLIGRIIGCANSENIPRWIGELRTLRPILVDLILDHRDAQEKNPPSMNIVVFLSYICYQFESGINPREDEMTVIRDIFEVIINRGPDFVVKGEKEGLMKFVKDKYSVPQYIIDLIFDKRNGQEYFQMAVICSSYVDKASASVQILLNENDPQLDDNDNRRLVEITSYFTASSHNQKQTDIFDKIKALIDLRRKEPREA